MNAVLNHLTIKYKLGLLGVIMVVGMLFIMAVAAWNLRLNLLEDRYLKTQDLVETASDMLEHFYREAQQGHITDEEAQAQALQLLRSMRYEGDNYFWVNRLDYTMLYHPTSTLNNTNVRHMKDPNGVALFVEIVNVVQQHKAGFVEYQWNKPGSTLPVDKVSYVQLFEPWGWIIGTGVYLDDVEEIFWLDIKQLGGLAFLGLLAISWGSLAVSRNIYFPLNQMSQMMQKMNETHDLTLKLDIHNHDELGEIIKVFNSMVAHFRDVLGEVATSSSRLTGESEKLTEVTQQTTRGLTQQQDDINHVSAASAAMNSATDQVASNAQNTLKASHTAASEMELCVSTLNNNIQTITRLGEQIEQSSRKTDQLKETSNSIGDIVAVIREIADQTNLLALNAAIEAARAGEQGRGFAVVADEVRTLAARTQDATHNVEAVIDKLQQGVSDTVQDMSACQKMATDSVTQAEEAGISITKMQQHIQQIADMNSAIGSAANEQNMTTQKLQETLEKIREISSRNADGSRYTADASDELARLAINLNQLITQFKV
ncbi:MAG: methyl-accepting chemotaxis protein [Marinobacterium sp.]|nr:methyl-accepting chemotaxis protein [Marinobacterium sp.]